MSGGVLDLLDSFKLPIEKRYLGDTRGIGRLSEWNSDIELRESKVCGMGLFAKKEIKKGTLLFELNMSKHRIIPIEEFWSFDKETRSNLYKYCWQIDHYKLIGPEIDKDGKVVNKENLEAIHLINHSSNANAWFEGDENLMASRDIEMDEEIFIDYAVIEANGLGESFIAKQTNERRDKFLQYDFERLWDEYKGHTHSYVHKLASFIKSHTFGEKDSPFFGLHHNLTSKIHPLGFGRGLFATGEIKKGEILWIERDEDEELRYITSEEIEKLEENDKNWVLHYGYQVDHHHLAMPLSTDVMEEDHSYLMNHSCNPNSVFYNARIILAFKDIKQGEEVTYDYATSDTLYDSLSYCGCGSEGCRKKVEKNDWFIEGLKEKYENFWQPYILGLFWRRNK